jgi:hypothetical protein
VTNHGPDVREDMSAMLAAAGIAVTEEGKASARAKLAAARARCTPEMYAALRDQVGMVRDRAA